MTGRFNCLICGADALEAIEGFAELPRVTSDCKPWLAAELGSYLGAASSNRLAQRADL